MILGIASFRWPRSAELPPSRSDGPEALFGVPSDQAGAGGAAVGSWEVVWRSGVNVRSFKSFSSPVLHVHKLHDVVRGRQEGAWIRLENENGFMAINAPGTGLLLTKIPTGVTGVDQQGGLQKPAVQASPPRPPAPEPPPRPPAPEPPPRPPAPEPPPRPPAPEPAAGCHAYGCASFDPSRPCQCNAECKAHGSCCRDYDSTCARAPALPAARPPSGAACDVPYNASGPSQCFCHLAGNPGCAGSPCPCPQGCTGVTWTSGRAVTFKNLARAHGCPSPVALLTIPKSYFADIQSLRSRCPAGTVPMLADLLRAGFEQYQRFVAPGPVKQCIHAAGATSQAWLHVHTICAGGSVDKMQQTTSRNWCGHLASAAGAEALARQLAAWAEAPAAAPTS